MTLEVVASQDLWFWHTYYVVVDSNNYLNAIYQTPLSDGKVIGKASKCSFNLNKEEFNHGYDIADGIYLSWTNFVKSLLHPAIDKKMDQDGTRNINKGHGIGFPKMSLRA